MKDEYLENLLKEIISRLDRIERNQGKVREVIEDASPPQGSFGTMES